MDFSKLKGTIYFNGKFLPSKKANIHVLNHSLHFATSVFEGIAVYNEKPFLSDDHLIKKVSHYKLQFLQRQMLQSVMSDSRHEYLLFLMVKIYH